MTAKSTSGAAGYARKRRGRGAPASRGRSREPSPAQFPQRVLRAFLISVGIGAGLILLFSIVAYFLPDPNPMIRPLAYTAVGLTALLGGTVAGRLHRGAPAVCGLINGILLLALMLLLSLFFRSLASGYSAWISALLHAAIPLLSFVGALIGVRHAQ